RRRRRAAAARRRAQAAPADATSADQRRSRYVATRSGERKSVSRLPSAVNGEASRASPPSVVKVSVVPSTLHAAARARSAGRTSLVLPSASSTRTYLADTKMVARPSAPVIGGGGGSSDASPCAAP